MKIYDVTMKIHPNVQVYNNKESKKPVFETVADFKDSGHRETNVTLNVHTGTHIDFPLHMIEGGQTSSSLDFKKYIREIKLFDLSHVNDAITVEDIKDLHINQGDFILLKTKNSFEDTFNPNFIYVKKDAAEYLASLHISGVGVDGLGIERGQQGHPTHLSLMMESIDIIEGLRLKDVEEGTYMMYGQAIPLQGIDACPMSVILVDND